MAAQTSHPVLHYFDVAARGELSKLIAAVGGVEMTIKEYPFAVSICSKEACCIYGRSVKCAFAGRSAVYL